MQTSIKKIGCALLFFCFFITVHAQLNIKVGYGLAYASPKVNNQITEQFNLSKPWLDQKLSDFHFIQGVHLGLRYRLPVVSLELTWRNRFKRISAEGIDPTDDSDFEQTLIYQYQSYSFGIENHFGKIGYGGSIDVNNLVIRTNKTGREDTYNVVDDWGLGSHLFLSYTVKSGAWLYVSVRPYVQVNWTKFDLAPLATELAVNTSGSSYLGDYMNFGVMFIFFNGE